MRSAGPAVRPRILLVEDDLIVQRVIVRVLGSLNAIIDPVDSAEEAFVRLDRQHYDLFLTDLHLPGMSGAELISNLREDAPGTPIILITGDPDEAIDRLDPTGRMPVLRKPFSNDELLTCVTSKLREAADSVEYADNGS